VKFLCICQYGHSRSVAMCRALHSRGHEAAALGWATAWTAIPTLAAWADRVVVVEPQFSTYVPVEFQGKVAVCDLGPDRWANPYHPELAKLCRKFCEEVLRA
jgi:hypothetical protein